MDLAAPTSIGLVGGGLAACSAAAALRAGGYDGRLLLVSEERHPPYDRPPLSKDALLTPAAELAGPPALLDDERARELDVEVVLGDRVRALDLDGGRLELASGARVEVDRVLLATGGTPRRLPVPGADLPEVAVLRTWDDAVRVRALVRGGGPVVVVGGGFIGLEVAAAARALGAEVTVVEVADRLLGRVLPDEIGARVERAHRATGIRFELGVGVVEVAGPGHVREVVLSDGRRLPAACVVVGIGMVPAVELAVAAGLEVGDGVVVDAAGRTSDPRVFAAGDVASVPHPSYGERVRVEQWQSAEAQGAAAAQAMLGLEPAALPVPWFWSDQAQVRLQVAGVPAHGRETVLRGSPEDGDHATLYLADGAVVGAVAFGRPQDVRGAIQLIQAGVVVDRAALADPATDLRRLAKSLRVR